MPTASSPTGGWWRRPTPRASSPSSELAAGGRAGDLKALVTSGARLSRFELAEPSLNKIFVDLVGPDAATAAARPDAEVARAVRSSPSSPQFVERVRQRCLGDGGARARFFGALVNLAGNANRQDYSLSAIAVMDGTTSTCWGSLDRALDAGSLFIAVRVAARPGTIELVLIDR